MRKAAGKLFEWKQPGLASWKKAQVLSADYFDLEYLYWVSRLMLNDSRIKNLTGRSILPANRVFSIVNEHLGYGKPGFRMPFLSQISVAEITTYLQNVLLRDTDQMSMAHALEVRVPFLDHELVEHVLTIPDSLKYPHTPKQLLTGSFPGLLPDEIIHRPKMGFSFPWDYWLKNELREFTADHLSDLGKNPLFNHFAINSLWSDFEQGKNGINWSRIWYLVVLQHWLHQNKVNG
jgi:asparagine synthase (glutamine-hydrolysing)